MDEETASLNPDPSASKAWATSLSFSHYKSLIPWPLLTSAHVSSKTPLVDSLNKRLLGTKYQASSWAGVLRVDSSTHFYPLVGVIVGFHSANLSFHSGGLS